MRRISILALTLTAALLAGCAGYQLGPVNGIEAGAQSVQVNFFKNDTIEPRLIEYVSNSLRKRLQQDGTYRLDTRNDGDIIINGVIKRFDRDPISFQPGDIITARDYGLSITARVTATERSTGKVILDRDISGRANIRAGADLPSSERQAIPILAEDLARNATSALTEGDW